MHQQGATPRRYCGIGSQTSTGVKGMERMSYSLFNVQDEQGTELIPITDSWSEEFLIYLFGFSNEKQNYF